MKKLMLLLLIAGLASSCSKEDKMGEGVYYKGELQCAVNWRQGSDEETLSNMTVYLKEKGITISKAELTKPPADRFFCAACGCPTGRAYIITVEKGSEKVLNEEGFYRSL